jgi:hypothetical protein
MKTDVGRAISDPHLIRFHTLATTHEHNKPALPSWLMDYTVEKALTETTSMIQNKKQL